MTGLMLLSAAWASTGDDLLALEQAWNEALATRDVEAARALMVPDQETGVVRSSWVVAALETPPIINPEDVSRKYGTWGCEALSWSQSSPEAAAVQYRCPVGSMRVDYKKMDGAWKRGGLSGYHLASGGIEVPKPPSKWHQVSESPAVLRNAGFAYQLRVEVTPTCAPTGEKQRRNNDYQDYDAGAEKFRVFDTHCVHVFEEPATGPCEPCEADVTGWLRQSAALLESQRPFVAGALARMAEVERLSALGTEEALEGALKDAKGRIVALPPGEERTLFTQASYPQDAVWSGAFDAPSAYQSKRLDSGMWVVSLPPAIVLDDLLAWLGEQGRGPAKLAGDWVWFDKRPYAVVHHRAPTRILLELAPPTATKKWKPSLALDPHGWVINMVPRELLEPPKE